MAKPTIGLIDFDEPGSTEASKSHKLRNRHQTENRDKHVSQNCLSKMLWKLFAKKKISFYLIIEIFQCIQHV